MDAESRQQAIINLVHAKGMVQIQWLAEHFNVTPQTIRRDIETLAGQSAVRRFRGGVTVPSSVENIAYATRQSLMAEEKRRIAELVARHVPEDASLFLNIGTTTEAVALALCGHRRLRVITNNLNVATIFHKNTSFPVSIAGGSIRERDGGIVGEPTVDFIRQYKVDIGIIGISGIDAEGDLLDYDEPEVRVARAIIESSRRIFLVADHTKFGRNATIRVAHVRAVDTLFTDRLPPPDLMETFAAADCQVQVADAAGQAVLAEDPAYED
ncbi:DeoR/GlpR family DNA-binding transcription regulator [Azospirillum thermophilum]|uniref:Transcriptional regulator n=1 Tax=Azospirillum thermophilum TaxID=2202148 RepID=A0A2S2CUX0_9PROT|nr:DeoR family transcriptional regulator [Azospirillum thermophilum]AWK88170.1 transcriptional regulator [Azospirillum thermophilum]